MRLWSRIDYDLLVITDESTCFRHPDSRAAVGCQRCDRPICSSCMKSASVGYHCPDCAKAGAQKVYRPGDLGSKPTLVYAIIGLCVLAYFGEISTGNGNWSAGSVYEKGVLFGPFVQDGEFWRILTSGFLHAGTFHLLLNMYALYIFGPAVVRAVGPLKAGLIYFGAMFAGSAAVLFFNWGTPTLGASGAVLGLAGGLAAILWARGIDIRQTNLMSIFIINLALPLIFPISFWGHFGGILGGFIVGWIVTFLPARFGTTERQGLVVGAVAVAGFAALALVGGSLALSPIL